MWGRGFGVATRRLYFRSRAWGLLPALAVAGLGAAGTLGRRGLSPGRSPVALALYASALLRRRDPDEEAIETATTLVDWLSSAATPGFSGPAWGHHFDWMTDLLLPAGTPTITVTPHVIDAAWDLFDTTGEPRHEALATGAARFVWNDLPQRPDPAGGATSGYTPVGIHGVVNATSYRAVVLLEAVARGALPTAAADDANENVASVLAAQRADGGWPYRITDTRNFTDTFHTCFVIEHLARIADAADREDAADAAARGCRFLIDRLLATPLPRRYVGGRRNGVIVADSYDAAESIACLVRLSSRMPDALDRASSLAERAIAELQRPDGAFSYRLYRGGRRSSLLSHRWAQAPMAYALESLRAVKFGESGSHS